MGQGEGLSVEGDTHHQFGWRCASLYPVMDGVIHIQVVLTVVGVVVEGSDVTGVFLPGTVDVVIHHSDPVQGFG